MADASTSTESLCVSLLNLLTAIYLRCSAIKRNRLCCRRFTRLLARRCSSKFGRVQSAFIFPKPPRAPILAKKLIVLLPITALLSACGDLYLDAPRGSHINLMTEKAPAQVRVQEVVWFKYWGNEPFSEPETHAATIIAKNNMKEARIRMVNTAVDGIVSMFTGPFGFPRRTLIVEGNPYSNGENAIQNKPSELKIEEEKSIP